MFKEEKYKPLRSILRSLPRIKAIRGFEQRLFERIREVDSKKGAVPSIDKLIHKETFWWLTSIFKPSLSPVLGLTVIILLVLIVYTYVDVIKKQDEISRSTTLEQTEKPDLTIYDRNEKLLTDKEKIIEERSLTPIDVDKNYKTEYAPRQPKTETYFGPVLEDVKRSAIEEQKIDEETEGKMMEKDEISLPREDDRSGERMGEDVIKKVEKKEIPETKGEEKIDNVDQEQKFAPFQYDKRKKDVNDTILKRDSTKTKDKGKKVDKKEEPLNKLPEEKTQEPDSLK